METSIVFPWNITGMPALFFGMHIAIKAKKLFKETNTPISPEASPTELHQNGLYGFSRNPMYLGIVVGLLGIALLSGLLVNLTFPLIYFLIMDRLFIVREEVNLEREFGKQFLNYKRKTRRWI